MGIFINELSIRLDMHNVVIHWEPLRRARMWAEAELNPSPLDKRLIAVDDVIADLVEHDPHVVLWSEKKKARNVAELFNREDRVTLYGCVKGWCLDAAYYELDMKGVEVTYHPEGCF